MSICSILITFPKNKEIAYKVSKKEVLRKAYIDDTFQVTIRDVIKKSRNFFNYLCFIDQIFKKMFFLLHMY